MHSKSFTKEIQNEPFLIHGFHIINCQKGDEGRQSMRLGGAGLWLLTVHLILFSFISWSQMHSKRIPFAWDCEHNIQHFAFIK